MFSESLFLTLPVIFQNLGRANQVSVGWHNLVFLTLFISFICLSIVTKARFWSNQRRHRRPHATRHSHGQSSGHWSRLTRFQWPVSLCLQWDPPKQTELYAVSSISGRLASSRRRPKNSLLLHFLRLVSEAGDRCVGRHGCPRRQPLVLALCADELRALVYLAMRQRVDNACLWHRLNVVSSAACCLVLCLHEERSYLKITGQIILLLKQMNCGVINLQ